MTVQPKLILFDFFGVLSSSAYFPLIEQQVTGTEREHWLQKLDTELDSGQVTEQQFAANLATITHQPMQSVLRAATTNARLNMELLNFIQQKLLPSHIACGLLTNAAEPLVRRILGDSYSLFDPIFVSATIGLRKPDPAIFQYVLNHVSAQPNGILFIDDSARNIEAAQKSGMNGWVHAENKATIEMLTKLI